MPPLINDGYSLYAKLGKPFSLSALLKIYPHVLIPCPDSPPNLTTNLSLVMLNRN